MVKKTTTAKKRTTTRRSAASTRRTTKVDYYPNRMGVAIAALAAVSLLLLGMLAVLN